MFVDNFQTLPWDALIYVTGQIVYGGRVTDELDRRCLISILNQFYKPDVLAVDNFNFSSNGVYRVPEQGSFHTMIDYVTGLPQEDDPEVFSMHSNADIALQRNELNRLIETIIHLQPRVVQPSQGPPPTAGPKGDKTPLAVSRAQSRAPTPEDVVDAMAQDLLGKIPPPIIEKCVSLSSCEHVCVCICQGMCVCFKICRGATLTDLSLALSRPLPPSCRTHPSSRPVSAVSHASGADSAARHDSLNMVRQQEMVRFNILLETCRKTLSQLRRAIKGLVVMSEDLDSMLSSIHNNQVCATAALRMYPQRQLSVYLSSATCLCLPMLALCGVLD